MSDTDAKDSQDDLIESNQDFVIRKSSGAGGTHEGKNSSQKTSLQTF